MTITVHFLGGARNVTGSSYLLETNGARVLVDCGLYQEREFQARNWERFACDPASLDAVLLTHAHLDHCGLLPKLVREGFRGYIHCTGATSEVAPVVLFDAARLQAEDAEYKAKRHAREGRPASPSALPLYTEDDVRRVLPHLHAVNYNESVPITEQLKAVFHDAGHILGSAMIRITVPDGGQTRSVLFSGDIGRWNRPILNDPDLFDQANYVVMESTYGDRAHDETADVQDQLAAAINDTVARGGNVIIPAFAIERAQELLYRFNQLLRAKRIPPLMVFLDSPMAVRVTEIFREHRELLDEETRRLIDDDQSPFTFRGLKFVSSKDESTSINRIRGTAVVIAGSGMCTGGRIKHHLVHNLERPECTILFVGYQANGTLGRQLIEGAREVRILGQMRQVRAKIVQIHGFSGHADRDELLRWLHGLKQPPRHVYAVHGGANVAQKFAAYVTAQTGWPASAPAYGDVVELA